MQVTGNQATYTPTADYNGADSFTFTAADATATSAPATVSLTVTPVNDAPVAVPQNATTAEDTATDITLSGTDVDGDPLTYALATQPAHGAVTLSGTRATYTPAADYHGNDSFTWTVSDGSATDTGSADVVVTSVNDAPTAGAVSSTTAAGGAVSIPLDGSDIDGDALTYAVAEDPAHGSVVVAGLDGDLHPGARLQRPGHLHLHRLRRAPDVGTGPGGRRDHGPDGRPGVVGSERDPRVDLHRHGHGDRVDRPGTQREGHGEVRWHDARDSHARR